ncbi:MAG: hypothetical protein HY899_07570 [Deltaproteobacteria bacterium]|nr:hypothetical protein [Deltaproteobacteria bacterium]
MLLHAAVARAATIKTCDALCPNPGACTIGETKLIEPDAVLDCRDRDIVVGNYGTIKVVGEFTLRARTLTLNGPSGAILAVEDDDGDPGAMTIEVVKDDAVAGSGNFNIYGKVRANGAHDGGDIVVHADGDITIHQSGDDGAEADGTGVGASGGSILLDAGGAILIEDPVHAAGNTSGDNSGGTLDIHAVGDITARLDGHIAAPGKFRGGGSVSIASDTGDVILQEHVDVDGRGNDGDGGSIEIEAGDSLQIMEAITARGGVGAAGGEASGGSVSLRSGCGGITVASSITVSGGDDTSGPDGGNGGSITAFALGNLTIASTGSLVTRALSGGGPGGGVSLRSASKVLVAGGAMLDVRGDTSSGGQGPAGRVALSGCEVEVAASATIDATGHSGGKIALHAGKAPPAQGAQPLLVNKLAAIHAAGGAGTPGRIAVAPLTTKSGTCANIPPRSCQWNTDCVEGCLTYECQNANPDVQGVSTQFDVAPEIYDENTLGSCEHPACGGGQ